MEMDHPSSGKIAVPGPAVHYNDFEVTNPLPPPLIGQHTTEILKNMLGYDSNTINDLLKSGIIAQNTLD